jgi:hypothetical protein
MQYQILEESTRGELTRTVTSYIKSGWFPLGGVSVAAINSMMSLHFFQAIVKDESS